MATITNEQLTGPLFTLLAEAFDKPVGVFLDKDTDLSKTLDSLSATQASTPTVPDGTTIAGHVFHVLFYLRVTYDYMEHRESGKIDWRDSWTLRRVNDAEWNKLRADLRAGYSDLTERLAEIADWSDEKRLGGVLGIIAHTAFHLGAIRQMMKVIARG